MKLKQCADIWWSKTLKSSSRNSNQRTKRNKKKRSKFEMIRKRLNNFPIFHINQPLQKALNVSKSVARSKTKWESKGIINNCNPL